MPDEPKPFPHEGASGNSGVNISSSAEITIGGDVVARDKIITNIQTIIQRALTAAEEAEQAQAIEARNLARGVVAFTQRLQARASETAESGGPYRGLLEYRLNDSELFFGRDQAVRGLLTSLGRSPLTILHSESGAGKTSLLQAGISSRLIGAGHLPLYLRPYNAVPSFAVRRAFTADPSHSPLRDFLRQASDVLDPNKTVLFILLDQFEEFFTQLADPERDEFIRELAECLEDPGLNVRWVLALRTEYFGHLANFRPRIRNPFENDFLLSRLTRAEAGDVIRKPAERRGLGFEEGLVDTLLDDLGKDQIAPPQMQLVCSALFDQLKPEETAITRALYEREGGAAGILRGHLERVLSRDLQPRQRVAARRLLESLISSEAQRMVRTHSELVAELKNRGVTPEMLDVILSQLVDSRLLRTRESEAEGGELAYELAHDYLLDEIKLDPDVQARKAAQELLEQELRAYRRYKTLLTSERLKVIEPYLTDLHLSREAMRFLAKSREVALRGEREEEARRQKELDDARKLAESETRRAEEQTQAARRLSTRSRIILAVGVIAIVLALAAGFFVIQSIQNLAIANRSAATAQVAQTSRAVAVTQQANAKANAATAQAQQVAAVTSAAGANATSTVAVQQQATALANVATADALGVSASDQKATAQAIAATANADSITAAANAATANAASTLAVQQQGTAQADSNLASTQAAQQNAAANAAKTQAAQQNAAANAASTQAAQQNAAANAAKTQAAAQQATAEANATIALAHSLASQGLARATNQFDLAGLLSLESLRIADTIEGRGSLLTTLQANPHLLQYLRGHTGAVTGLAFRPNSNMLISASDNGEIILWDLTTRRPIGPPFQDSPVQAIAISPDGNILAWCSSDPADKKIRLWNLQTRQLITELGDDKPVTSLAFSPDLDLQHLTLAAGSTDSYVTLWSVSKGSTVWQSSRINPVESVAFSPDGKMVATGNQQTIELWKASDGSHISSVSQGLDNRILSLAFDSDPTRNLLASGGADHTIRLWDTTHPLTVTLLAQINDHSDAVTGLAFSPDGNILVSSSLDSTVRVWNVKDPQNVVSLTKPLTGHTSQVNAVAIRSDGRTIASGSSDTTLILWDALQTASLGQIMTNTAQSSITSVAITGTLLATGTENSNNINFWDMHSPPQWLGTVQHTDTVLSVAFGKSGPGDVLVLAASDAKRNIIFWDASTRRLINQLKELPQSVKGLAFSPNGNVLVSVDANGDIQLWDTSNPQGSIPPIGPPRDLDVTSVAFSLDPLVSLIASGGRDGTVQLWNDDLTPNGTSIPVFSKAITSVTFGPNNTLAVGGEDGTVRLLDVTSRKLLGSPFTGHTASITDVAFSRDGKLLAASSVDKSVILWDVATGQRIGQPFTRHTLPVRAVEFTPDGKILVSGSDDALVIAWDIDVASWQAYACDAVGRNLTQAEWSLYLPGVPYQKTCDQWPEGK